MSRYIVTGGAGFIGSHLTDLLITEGHDVIVIDDFSVGSYAHPDATIIRANILDEKKIKPLFQGVDGCFHLVAIPSLAMSLDKWFFDHSINLNGSLIVFKAAIEAGNIPVVYASSCAVYGDCPKIKLKESSYVRPISSYGCDKLAVELNAYALFKNYHLPTIGLRFFNVYGPRQNPNSPYCGVIAHFISRMQEDKAPIIYGNGEQIRDFIFVTDIAKGLMHAMSLVGEQEDVINLCTGNETSINQLAQQINFVMQKDIAPKYCPARSYDTFYSLGCTEKMYSLGFEKPHGLLYGLRETINEQMLAI